MTDEERPNPLGALQVAAGSTGASLPDGLLEQVLALETEATEQNQDRALVQSTLRALIEAGAKAQQQ
jgi:hypothetical protein